MKKDERVARPVIAEDELERIRAVQKDCGLTREELFDESRAVLGRGHGEVNRRWKQSFTCDGYRMTLAVRVLDEDPRDFSILLFVEIVGKERCICRLDSKGRHKMGWAGLQDIVGPHMHWLRECDQRITDKDDSWAEPVDIHSFEDGMGLFIVRLNIITRE